MYTVTNAETIKIIDFFVPRYATLAMVCVRKIFESFNFLISNLFLDFRGALFFTYCYFSIIIFQ